jgi:hypothetical protein
MSYSKRIQIAAALSILLHALGLFALHYVPQPAPAPTTWPPKPIELDLQPDAPAEREPVQLVDVAQPAPMPVPPATRIAEQNAEAMDKAPTEVEQSSPRLAPEDFDKLAKRATPESKPVPPIAPPVRESEEENTAEESQEPTFEEMEEHLEGILNAKRTPEEVDPQDEPIQVAQADPSIPQRPSPGTSRARESGAKQGITNFQAIQSEIAPYLKHVRAQVEREWNEMLYTRYSGTSPVKAVIDCAISPSGELISVSAVGTPNDRLYSALCRDAVQRAGPFGPFPFAVPDIYRDKNLEIRWTFSFL